MVNKVVKKNILKLPGFLNSYSKFKNTNHLNFLISSITKYLYHTTVSGMMDKIFEEESFTIPSLSGLLIDSSVYGQISPDNLFSTIIRHFLNETNENNILSYMYLSYIYRYYPEKYINILSIILRKYVEDKIVKPSDSYINYDDVSKLIDKISSSFNELLPGHLISILEELEGDIWEEDESDNIDSKYKSYLGRIYQIIESNFNISFIYDNWIENEGSDFSTISYFISFFDEWIESDNFDKFLETLLFDVYTVLNKNGHVEYNFNWYQKIMTLKLYFKSLLRYSLTNKDLFSNISSQITEEFNNFNSEDFGYYSEILSTDCSELHLSTKYQFDPETLLLYFKNGDYWIQFDDYTVSHTTHLISLFYIPGYDEESLSGSSSGFLEPPYTFGCDGIKAMYYIDYPVSFNMEFERFKYQFEEFLSYAQYFLNVD
jgi:hypothetical protein